MCMRYIQIILTDEYANTIKKKTLESNILSDFGLQIKTLEKKLNLDKNYMKLLRENQRKYRRSKLNQNATLLAGCSNTKIRNVDLLKNIEDLSAELKIWKIIKIIVQKVKAKLKLKKLINLHLLKKYFHLQVVIQL